jgi:hypothetical protein
MTQSVNYGYQVYEEAKSDDFWYFSLALETYNGVIDNGKILYQWITFEDQSSNPDKPFAVGCKLTVGTEDDFEIQAFELGTDDALMLFANSTEVIGKTWTTQAVDYQEEEEDTTWEAGKTYAQAAPESDKFNSTNRACYFVQRLPKIGRNPADFEHTYKVTIGGRIYDTAESTTFFDIAPQSEALDQGKPAEFVSKVITGAVSNMVSAVAAGFMMLFALSF